MMQKMRNLSRENTVVIILLSILIGILLLNMGIWIDRNIELLPKLSDIYESISKAKLDFIIAHASMTFISISVMSVLSENNMMVYWENVIKERLINPPFLCFASLTIYAFSTLLFAFISYFLSFLWIIQGELPPF